MACILLVCLLIAVTLTSVSVQLNCSVVPAPGGGAGTSLFFLVFPVESCVSIFYKGYVLCMK